MGVPEKALIAADEIVEYIPQRPPIVMADAFYGIGDCDNKIKRRAGFTARKRGFFGL